MYIRTNVIFPQYYCLQQSMKKFKHSAAYFKVLYFYYNAQGDELCQDRSRARPENLFRGMSKIEYFFFNSNKSLKRGRVCESEGLVGTGQ